MIRPRRQARVELLLARALQAMPLLLLSFGAVVLTVTLAATLGRGRPGVD